MTMDPKMNLPVNLARWATGANRTLEPDSTWKDSGWNDSTKPPARWQNWLQKLNYEWTQRIGGLLVGNWQVVNSAITASLPEALIHHPTMEDGGLWMLINSAEAVIKSVDGRNWTAAGTNVLDTLASRQVAAIDSSNIIFGGIHSSSTGLAYTSNKGVSWSVDTGIPESVAPNFIVSKYPDSDLLIAAVSAGTNKVYIASGGVGSSWVAATTDPGLSLEGGVRVGANSFMGIGGAGVTYISSDDGDTWAGTPGSPSDVGLNSIARAMGCDRETGTIVAVGTATAAAPTNVATVAFTRNQGLTWTRATVYGAEQSTKLENVYACGGGLWFANGVLSGLGSGAGFVSFDDAETWYPASYFGDRITPSAIQDVASDGRMLLAARSDNRVAHSLSIPGYMP